ncbi:MAG: glutamate--cysteine ligase, partial [Sandaracinaceae bacterium]|nr:glutamate--cysteine ligase [Sandaracinaceae bacterium]
ELIERHGWTADREHARGELIALRRGEASITLEPGGQLELSGAPVETIHQTSAELRGHLTELRGISDELGIAWLGLGYHPTATQEELPWIPKLRYGVMREYLPTRGTRGLDMMRRTATVQANLDYASEEDAMRKLRVTLAISPVIGAAFANSPFAEGRKSALASERAQVWTDVDPERTGLLPFAWRDRSGYRDYVEWALDAPMFLVKRGDKLVRNTGQTFRSFMADGFGGARATHGDWTTHLNTLFPDVRLKRTIELRAADGQPSSTLCALPALSRGLLYDATALGALEAMLSSLRYEDVHQARSRVPQEGLRASMAGRPLLEWARELVRLASEGLRRLARLDRRGRDESIHLEALAALLEKGQSPGDALRESVDADRPLFAQLLDSEHARL